MSIVLHIVPFWSWKFDRSPCKKHYLILDKMLATLFFIPSELNFRYSLSLDQIFSIFTFKIMNLRHMWIRSPTQTFYPMFSDSDGVYHHRFRLRLRKPIANALPS